MLRREELTSANLRRLIQLEEASPAAVEADGFPTMESLRSPTTRTLLQIQRHRGNFSYLAEQLAVAEAERDAYHELADEAQAMADEPPLQLSLEANALRLTSVPIAVDATSADGGPVEHQQPMPAPTAAEKNASVVVATAADSSNGGVVVAPTTEETATVHMKLHPMDVDHDENGLIAGRRDPPAVSDGPSAPQKLDRRPREFTAEDTDVRAIMRDEPDGQHDTDAEVASKIAFTYPRDAAGSVIDPTGRLAQGQCVLREQHRRNTTLRAATADDVLAPGAVKQMVPKQGISSQPPASQSSSSSLQALLREQRAALESTDQKYQAYTVQLQKDVEAREQSRAALDALLELSPQREAPTY